MGNEGLLIGHANKAPWGTSVVIEGEPVWMEDSGESFASMSSLRISVKNNNNNKNIRAQKAKFSASIAPSDNIEKTESSWLFLFTILVWSFDKTMCTR